LEIEKRMKARGWSRADLAFVCGRKVSFVNKLISGRQRITATSALLLGAIFQEPGEFWMDLQIQYDLASHVPDEAKMAAIRERAAAHERGESIAPKRCAACGQRIRR
jgi:plasmid maintenance system antidote protein VapI